MSFTKALQFIAKWEGGFSDHKSDRGGATNFGVTQATYDRYRKNSGLPLQPVKFIHESEVQAIYKLYYWMQVKGDAFEYPLALCLFDAAVQHGAGRSVRWLQEIVGAKQDGDIGQVTFANVSGYKFKFGDHELLRALLNRREDFYREIVDNDASQAVFLKGWMNRLNDLRKEVGV